MQEIFTRFTRTHITQTELNFLSLSKENSQRQLRDCDWIIARHEIQMTDKCLGRGGWGSVYEGVYCGCAVAVYYSLSGPQMTKKALCL